MSRSDGYTSLNEFAQEQGVAAPSIVGWLQRRGLYKPPYIKKNWQERRRIYVRSDVAQSYADRDKPVPASASGAREEQK